MGYTHIQQNKKKMSKATGSQPSEPIEIEDDDDWPDQGLVNGEEAQAFVNKIDNIFDTFSDRVRANDKDALPKLVHEYKKLVKKHWRPMAEADEQVIVALVYDRNCIYLWQHLDPSGVTTYELEFEWKEGWEFLRDMPEKKRSHKVQMMIIDTMDHASAAWSHSSQLVVNLSSLSKIADPETFRLILKACTPPLIQVNIPAWYLNPVEQPKPQTMSEKHLEMLWSCILPRGKMAVMEREPENGATHLLAAAIHLKLKHKYMNGGVVKNVCEKFKVWAKQLSKIMTGRKYLGGGKKCPASDPPKKQGKRQETSSSWTAVKEAETGDKEDEDELAGATGTS